MMMNAITYRRSRTPERRAGFKRGNGGADIGGGAGQYGAGRGGGGLTGRAGEQNRS